MFYIFKNIFNRIPKDTIKIIIKKILILKILLMNKY